MTEQIGVALPFTAFYTTLGIGQTGLTVTVDVYRNGTEIVTAGSATDAGDGLYTYTLASGSNTVEGIYIAVFKTATTTVDQQHLVAGWEVGTGGVENLDAAVSSRSVAGDAMTLTAGERTTVSSSVWSSATRTLTSFSTFVADVWAYATRTLTSAAGVTVEEIDAQLSATHGAGLWGGAGGSGAIATTITIDDGTNPLDGVDVWATTDSGGTNIVARGFTNTSGNVIFYLDAGTYYIFKQFAGYSFTNPQTLVV
jgi:flagellar hook-associated protein FlgK